LELQCFIGRCRHPRFDFVWFGQIFRGVVLLTKIDFKHSTASAGWLAAVSTALDRLRRSCNHSPSIVFRVMKKSRIISTASSSPASESDLIAITILSAMPRRVCGTAGEEGVKLLIEKSQFRMVTVVYLPQVEIDLQ
jgi:hypothetical protein